MQMLMLRQVQVKENIKQESDAADYDDVNDDDDDNDDSICILIR
jgi:hypothetical protein